MFSRWGKIIKTWIYSFFRRQSWEKISENLSQMHNNSKVFQSINWWVCILTRKHNLSPTHLMGICDSFSHHSSSSSLKVADEFCEGIMSLCPPRGLIAVILSKAPLPFPYFKFFLVSIGSSEFPVSNIHIVNGHLLYYWKSVQYLSEINEVNLLLNHSFCSHLFAFSFSVLIP